jgi:hypothetical protein
MNASGGFCMHCGNWVDAGERCDCERVSGYHSGYLWGEVSPGQENAIRCLEDSLSLLGDYDSGQAA